MRRVILGIFAMAFSIAMVLHAYSQIAPSPAANASAGNLVFHGETAGSFAAVDATTGKTLWSFPTNDSWRASPMTYSVNGEQYVAVAAGTNVIAFRLGN